MNLEIAHQRTSYVIPNEFKEKLEKALQVSWYGRNFFKGLHSYASQEGTFQKVKTYALAIFGTLFAGATTYFSFDGSVRMIQWSLDEEDKGNPLPSDIGHGGEWSQQPFQYGLAIHMYLLTAFANHGHLGEVKSLYAKLINELLTEEEGKDITELYRQFEDDFSFLTRRCFAKMNPLQVKLELLKIFKRVDTRLFRCPPLVLDRALKGDYKQALKEIRKLDKWKLSNIKENWKIGLSQMYKRGIGQTIETGACFTTFQLAMLFSTGFMLWGLSIVFDEVFLSKSGPEGSGHLSEWSINILTNFLLMYVIYSWLIKREATLHRTKEVMRQHLSTEPRDVEEGVVNRPPVLRNRLIEIFNNMLDGLAEKCYFNHLPSQYRFEKVQEVVQDENSDSEIEL